MNPSGTGISLALSNDGRTIAYRGGAPGQLFVRSLDALEPTALAGTEGASNPSFSPDDRWIAFLKDGSLWKMPTIGGPLLRIVSRSGRFSWGSTGTIVFSRPSGDFLGGLFRVSAEGGAAEQVTSPDSVLGNAHASPLILPDGRTVIFTSVSAVGQLTLGAFRLGERTLVPLGVRGSGAMWIPGGYLVFGGGDGSMSAVRLDAKRLSIIGEPVTVLDSVGTKSGVTSEATIAPNGTLLYLRGAIGTQLAEVSRNGNNKILISAIHSYTRPRLSPDGRRVAVAIGQPPLIGDIWIFDRPSETLTRFTTDGRSASPEWSPDGRRVVWTAFPPALTSTAARTEVRWQPWDRSEPAALLMPDGRGAEVIENGGAVIASIDVANGAEVRRVPLPFTKSNPGEVLLAATPPPSSNAWYRPSPDGRWLAYVSVESGASEVYVRAISRSGGRIQVSNGGGILPEWNPKGGELF